VWSLRRSSVSRVREEDEKVLLKVDQRSAIVTQEQTWACTSYVREERIQPNINWSCLCHERNSGLMEKDPSEEIVVCEGGGALMNLI
jgi:hypothetical protein